MSILLRCGCFLVFCQDGRGKSRGHKRYSKRKKLYSYLQQEMREHPSFDRSRFLFTSPIFQSTLPTQELLPSPFTGKLPLISAGARKRYFSACTGSGAIDSCRTALTAALGYSTTWEKRGSFPGVFSYIQADGGGKLCGWKKITGPSQVLLIPYEAKPQLSLYNTCKPLWKQHQNPWCSQKGIRKTEHDTQLQHVPQVSTTRANAEVPWSARYRFLCLFCMPDKRLFTSRLPKSF